MPLSVADRVTVARQVKDVRNAAARFRRASLAHRLRDVTVYPIELDGVDVLLALSQADPNRPYLLRRDEEGRWRCGCFAATYSASRTCSHLEAIRVHEAAGVSDG